MGVLTATIAIIKVNGVSVESSTKSSTAVGICRDIRYTENISRGAVRGIGNMNPSEVPALTFAGNLTAGFMNIKFDKHPFFEKAIVRKTGSKAGFYNTLALQQIGFTLDLLRKVPDTEVGNDEGRDANNVIIVNETKYEHFVSIGECFITSDSFDLTENQISGRNSAFDVIDAATYGVEA